MTSQQQPSRLSLRTISFVVAFVVVPLTLVGTLMWALTNPATVKQWIGDGAWSLTYEASSVSGAPKGTALSYQQSGRKDTRRGPTQLPWKTEVAVEAGKEARVEVTPAANGVVSCRILLDGVRTVAEAKSPGPGKPAVCSVVTSSTPEKWPR